MTAAPDQLIIDALLVTNGRGSDGDLSIRNGRTDAIGGSLPAKPCEVVLEAMAAPAVRPLTDVSASCCPSSASLHLLRRRSALRLGSTLAALLVGAGAFAPPLQAEPSPVCIVPTAPAQVPAGSLVIGCVPAGHAVEVAGRPVRVDSNGRFVFGIGRSEPGPVVLQVQDSSGRHQQLEVAVVPRDYPVERVSGLPQQTVTPDPQIAARIAREQAQVAAARSRDDARSDFASGFTAPVKGRISGVYGSQRVLNGTPRSPHMGLDIAAPNGTPVLAPAAGVVSFAADALYLTGGTVLLDHGHGLSSSFLHLSKVDVQPGDKVERGQRIGAVGATGRASGPHLHWGFNWFDVRLDPQLLPGPGASVGDVQARDQGSAR